MQPLEESSAFFIQQIYIHLDVFDRAVRIIWSDADDAIGVVFCAGDSNVFIKLNVILYVKFSSLGILFQLQKVLIHQMQPLPAPTPQVQHNFVENPVLEALWCVCEYICV